MSEPIPPPVPSDLYPYLNEIAERLFSGHAAVMIGSGFSRNAQPRGGSSPQFPDWPGLGDLFYEKLHHKRPDAGAKYLSVPTLANEVEAALGRPALDRILSSAIPDQDHEPAALHISVAQISRGRTSSQPITIRYWRERADQSLRRNMILSSINTISSTRNGHESSNSMAVCRPHVDSSSPTRITAAIRRIMHRS